MSDNMRDDISSVLKIAQKEQQKRRISTLRLILAAIGERDILLRGKGKDKADNDEILDILTRMIRQRRESSAIYRETGSLELEEQELEEIEIISEFLPRILNEEESQSAIGEAIRETGAESLRDMGKVMGVLKEKYRGQLDMAKTGVAIRMALGTEK